MCESLLCAVASKDLAGVNDPTHKRSVCVCVCACMLVYACIHVLFLFVCCAVVLQWVGQRHLGAYRLLKYYDEWFSISWALVENFFLDSSGMADACVSLYVCMYLCA